MRPEKGTKLLLEVDLLKSEVADKSEVAPLFHALWKHENWC